MALSFDDKILGEKTDYYCSSDEGSDNENEACAVNPQPAKPSFIPESEVKEAVSRGSINTGPKGVIEDWRNFKKLETERREKQELEKIELAKRLTLSSRPAEDAKQQEDEDLMKELDELEDEFMRQYREKRLAELRNSVMSMPRYGKLYNINDSSEFLECVDKCDPRTTIIIHIWEDGVKACEAMNGCLLCMAQDYPHVKFYKVKASDVRMTHNFQRSGVPAILVYKAGQLIGNHVCLTRELGEDFFASDVESLLHAYGTLPPKDELLRSIRESFQHDNDDEGSDYDVD